MSQLSSSEHSSIVSENHIVVKPLDSTKIFPTYVCTKRAESTLCGQFTGQFSEECRNRNAAEAKLQRVRARFQKSLNLPLMENKQICAHGGISSTITSF